MRYSSSSLGLTILIFMAIGIAVFIWHNQDELSHRQFDCPVQSNAAWISVDWTSQPVDETAISQLAINATERKIRYLYPFTTYARENDFSPSYDNATGFVSTFKQFNQETYLLAWVGIPLKRTGDIGVDGWTDLGNEAERKTIVEFIGKLVKESGFDGVHLNVETVWAGNRDYLLLLDEMKEALGTEYMLSVTGHTWRGEENPIDAGDYRWNREYYQAVGERVDQIVAMTYDSMAESVEGYHKWLGIQMQGMSESLAEAETELLLGISVSREQTLTHNPDIENMVNSLNGICSELMKQEKTIQITDGIAVYAAWEASEKDWIVWEEFFRVSGREN